MNPPVRISSEQPSLQSPVHHCTGGIVLAYILPTTPTTYPSSRQPFLKPSSASRLPLLSTRSDFSKLATLESEKSKGALKEHHCLHSLVVLPIPSIHPRRTSTHNRHAVRGGSHSLELLTLSSLNINIITATPFPPSDRTVTSAANPQQNYCSHFDHYNDTGEVHEFHRSL